MASTTCLSSPLCGSCLHQTHLKEPQFHVNFDCPVFSTRSPSGSGLAELRARSGTKISGRKTRRKFCRAATGDEQASTSQSEAASEAASKPARRYVRRPKLKVQEADPNLKTYSVEDDNVVVEGVARIDRGEESLSFGRLALLVAGDTAALLLFALAGKVSHSGTADLGIVSTAAPFLIGWFVAAPLLGAYGADATLSGPLNAATKTGTAWAVGVPLGIVIRGALKGQVPPTPFIIVTLASTLVLLVAWRAALAAAGGKRSADDRSGNSFEFLELLSSLVRRW